MWETLEKYQPYADADGHGDSWRVMCSERTQEAAWTASVAARGEASAMAYTARCSAYWYDSTINRIKQAIKERT
jgi:hypothetical protein